MNNTNTSSLKGFSSESLVNIMKMSKQSTSSSPSPKGFGCVWYLNTDDFKTAFPVYFEPRFLSIGAAYH